MNELHIHIDENAGFALLCNVFLNRLTRSGWGGNEVRGRQRELYLLAAESLRAAREEVENEVNRFIENCGRDERAIQAVISGVYANRGFDLAEKLTKQRQALCN